MLGSRISYISMSLLGIVSASLPSKIRGKIGERLGLLMKVFSRRRQEIALQNLAIAFPDYNLSKRIAIMTNSFKNLGITFLEVAALKHLNADKVKDIIELKNFQLINKTLARGNGTIMLSGHYSNWEYLALAAGLYAKVPITVVVKKQKNELVDNDLNNARTMFGNKIVLMTNAARALIGAIKRNEAVALLVDQSAKKGKDSFVEFFGKPALTFDAPAELALRFRTPIVYAFAVRNPDYTYTAHLRELDFSDLEYSKENVSILTKRHVSILEEQIRNNPDLWAWQHRRWKYVEIYPK